jgi:predicted PurR-regulated permease PerM
MVQLIKKIVKFPSNKIFSLLEILELTVLISIILYFGKTLFIPLSFAVLISFILYPICKWLEKIGIHKIISIFIALSIVFIIFGAIMCLFIFQVAGFLDEWHIFKLKLSEAFIKFTFYLNEQFGVQNFVLSDVPKKLLNSSGKQLFEVLINTLYSISISTFFIIIIPVFSVLILYYRQMLTKVLYTLFPSKNKETIQEIIIETIHAYYNFVKGMLLVYLIVGVLNSIGLALIGIPHPILFGFIASILTFIPYVGILISALIPIAISWVTYDSIWYPLGIILVFTVVQILEANIIFPFVVGNRLKINTLAIIIVIIIGGILWGAAGMILFIPFLSIVKLIADRTEGLKTLSLLLGSEKTTK